VITALALSPARRHPHVAAWAVVAQLGSGRRRVEAPGAATLLASTSTAEEGLVITQKWSTKRVSA
jgi:hypothetical protein